MRTFAVEPTSATQECAKVGSRWLGFDTLHKSAKPYRLSFSFSGRGIGLQGLTVGSRFLSRSLVSAAHCLFRQFDDSELRHHRRQVPVCISFSDFRTLETIDRGAIDRRPYGWWAACRGTVPCEFLAQSSGCTTSLRSAMVSSIVKCISGNALRHPSMWFLMF